MLTYGQSFMMQGHLGARAGGLRHGWSKSISADLDRDGRDEIVIAAEDSVINLLAVAEFPLTILSMRGAALVDVTPEFLPGDFYTQFTRDIFAEDFNNDGRLDLFINNFGTEGIDPFPGEQNALFLQQPDGTFADATNGLPQFTDNSHGAVIADFDRDGFLDIFVNNLGGAEEFPTAYLIFNDGTGKFSARNDVRDESNEVFGEGFDANSGPNYPGLLDIGADGIPDIYFPEMLNRTPDFQTVFSGFGYALNDGTGKFTAVLDDTFRLPQIVIEGNGANEDAQAGDIDGDGDLDLVTLITNFDSGDFAAGTPTHFQVFRNDGPAGYTEISDRIEGQENGAFLPVAFGAPEFELVDHDADGDLDIVYSKYSGNPDPDIYRTFFFENDGTGRFTRLPDAAFPGRALFEFADINGDWLPDIVNVIKDYDLPDEFALGDGFNGTQYIEYHIASLPEAVNRTGFQTADRIAGGSANDTLNGAAGDDSLNGNGGNDVVIGGPGNDVLFGGPGNDLLNGGVGRDIAPYAATRATFDHATGEDGVVTAEVAGQGTDRLASVEEVILADGSYLFGPSGPQLEYVYRVYDAAFGRTPDGPGLVFWYEAVVSGVVDALELAGFFVESPEFDDRYPSASDAAFIDALYINALRRPPEPDGKAFWLAVFQTGEQSRADMLEFFANSPENIARNAENYDDGVWVT